MAVLRHTLEALLNPFFICWLALLVLSGLVHSPRWVKRSLFLLVFVWFILSTGFLPQLLTQRLEGKHEWLRQVDPNVRWVVVLSGGQSTGNNYPANTLLYSASIKRLVEGLRLLAQLPKAKLLLSGGGYGAEISESSHLADVVLGLGV